MSRLILRPQAERELAEAVAWYNTRDMGLGSDFLLAVDATMDDILDQPARFPEVRSGRRRALVGRFPYALYFTVLDDDIVILAVFHGKRHPRRWQSRQ